MSTHTVSQAIRGAAHHPFEEMNENPVSHAGRVQELCVPLGYGRSDMFLLSRVLGLLNSKCEQKE